MVKTLKQIQASYRIYKSEHSKASKHIDSFNDMNTEKNMIMEASLIESIFIGC